MDPWIWIGSVVLLLAIEAATVGLTTIWFAGGALAAAIACWAGAGDVIQWALFLGVSLIFLIFTRPLAVRYMNRGVPRTNVEGMIGKRAVVTQKINNLAQSGQVKLGDIEWRVRTVSDEEIIPEDVVVVIRAVQGVTLIVEQEKEE